VDDGFELPGERNTTKVTRRPSFHSRTRSAASLSALLLVFCLIALPAAGHALSPYHGWTISEITFQNLPDDLAREIRQGLALNLRSGLLGNQRARFSERVLNDDLERIRLFLARNGYPRSEIEVRLEPDSRRKRVKVVFAIKGDTVVKYGDIRITGLPAHLQNDGTRLLGRIKPGNRFNDKAVTRTVTSIDSLLQANGYARTEVVADISLNDSSEADLTFLVDPGVPYRFESVVLKGVPADLESVTMRTIALKPSTPYTPALIERVRNNLRTLSLFRQIRITWEETGPETLEMVVELQVASPRTANLSVGSWSDDPWRFTGFWAHRNLFKRGRGLAVDGMYSQFRRRFMVRTWWLALMGPRTRNEIFTGYERQDEDSFRADIYSLGTAALLDYGNNSSLRFGITATQNDVEEKIPEVDDFQKERGLQTIFDANLFLDRSNHILVPTRGTRWNLGFAVSPPGFLSESPFARVETEGVWYLGLSEQIVLAQRLSLTTAWPLADDQELLANRRLFAGGVSTHRAYQRHKLGPLNVNLEPVGGEARILFNQELRFPLFSIFGGEVFLDVGQVWQKLDMVQLSDLRVGAGGGVSILTPVGPIRFDLGYNLTEPASGLPRAVFHVNVGNPF
jgi:outer membrane protein assembly complex protein YaeT